MSTESCNSTANYAGSLPDDLICFDDVNNDDKCQINVNFNKFQFQKQSFIIRFPLHYRLTKELHYCAIQVQSHHGK